MLSSLLRRKPRPLATPPAAAPEGVRVFAIGDVHGRDDLLGPLLDRIAADAGPKAAVVFLGDYVDRGPASRGVIERLIRWRDAAPVESRFLMGNHDDTVLKFLADADAGPSWCEYGGAATLESYGVGAPLGRGGPEAWTKARDAFSAAIPSEHVQFFRSLEPCAVYGDYFFAHAGARPGTALEDQSAHDLMWIRDDFLTSAHAWSKVVVHGHTPEEQPFLSHRRIGVDTGAYATHRLTAVVLEGTERRLLQARGGAGRPVTVEMVAAPHGA